MGYSDSHVLKYKTLDNVTHLYWSLRYRLHCVVLKHKTQVTLTLLYWSTRHRLLWLPRIEVQDIGCSDSLVLKYTTQFTLTLLYWSTIHRLLWLSLLNYKILDALTCIEVLDTGYVDSVLHQYNEPQFALNVLSITTLQTLHCMMQYRRFITAILACKWSQFHWTPVNFSSQMCRPQRYDEFPCRNFHEIHKINSIRFRSVLPNFARIEQHMYEILIQIYVVFR